MPIYLNNKDTNTTIHTNDAKGAYGTYYLANNPKHYEIQRNNNFMFYINFEAGFLSDDIKLKELNSHAANPTNTSDIVRISVDSSFVPHFKNSPIELKRGNNTMKFAGVPTFDAGQIKFTDFIGAGTKDILMAWQRKVYDVNTEKVGLAADYKHDAFLIELTPDYQVVRTWKLCGCWISALSEDDYSHDSNDRHTITCSIEYDKAFVDTTDIDTSI